MSIVDSFIKFFGATSTVVKGGFAYDIAGMSLLVIVAVGIFSLLTIYGMTKREYRFESFGMFMFIPVTLVTMKLFGPIPAVATIMIANLIFLYITIKWWFGPKEVMSNE